MFTSASCGPGWVRKCQAQWRFTPRFRLVNWTRQKKIHHSFNRYIYIYTHDHICLYINHLCLWAMASIAMEQIARGGSVVITENGGSSTWNVPVFASHFFWGIWTGLHRESLKHGGQNHRAWEDGGFQHSSGWKINAWIITEYVLYKISTEYVLYITVLRILVTAPVLLGSKGQS